MIEADDAYTGQHTQDVVELTVAVADRLGVDEETRRAAEFGALLHDVGKVAIPNEIINKPGPLDDDEWAIMKTHTIEGQRMLERVGGLLARVGVVVRASHERYDGGGYPDGLAGEAIPLAARIVSACDAFNAMTTDRSYRKALSLEVAVAELRNNAGHAVRPGRGRGARRRRVDIRPRRRGRAALPRNEMSGRHVQRVSYDVAVWVGAAPRSDQEARDGFDRLPNRRRHGIRRPRGPRRISPSTSRVPARRIPRRAPHPLRLGVRSCRLAIGGELDQTHL